MNSRNLQTVRPGWIWLAATAVAVSLGGCERPPVDTEQTGFRGTAMVQVTNPRRAREAIEIPPAQPQVPQGGPTAGEIYQNVQVLGDLSVAEFARTMAAMTQWIAPAEGCNYCHNPQNLAAEGLYTKDVSRRMLEMTRHINRDWADHVGTTGVTCFTCHAGQPVPAEIWFEDSSEIDASHFAGWRAGQNIAAESVGYTSLPTDSLSGLLTSEGSQSIRVLGSGFHPDPGGASIQATEKTYGLMMHMSGSLGVNCTFCHNTNSFGTWTGSTPQRAKSWHGLQMVRELNDNFLIPLGPVYPPHRMGKLGDPPKANCATCHGGQNKPLGGAQMAGDYPGLTPR